MTIKYKNQWEPMSVNEEFWKEVLVGRTITDIVLTGRGVVALKLDNGENIRFTKESTIYIQQDATEIKQQPESDCSSLDYFKDKYSKAIVSTVTSDNIESDLRMLTHRQLQDRTIDYDEQRKYLSNLLFELHLKLK